jgi:DNA-directed RNA polymerase specialized sigma24 family protein
MAHDALVRTIECGQWTPDPFGSATAIADSLVLEEQRDREVLRRFQSDFKVLWGEVVETRDGFRIMAARQATDRLLRCLERMPALEREVWQSARVWNIPRMEIARRSYVRVETMERALRQADETVEAALSDDGTPDDLMV